MLFTVLLVLLPINAWNLTELTLDPIQNYQKSYVKFCSDCEAKMKYLDD